MRLMTPAGPSRRPAADLLLASAARPAAGARARRHAPIGTRASAGAARDAAAGRRDGGAPYGQRSALVMIGDSLALGSAAPMVADLPDWDVRADARVGWPLAEGMGVVSGLDLSQVNNPAVLAISPFTRIARRRRRAPDTGRLSAAYAAVRAGAQACG
jgi:hypothetical protein